MDASFWLEGWRQNRLGFHQAEVNPYLQKFWPTLNVSKAGRVLVPLCGKSLDMVWLRDQGHAVVGVELSSLAAEAFFAENGIEATQTELSHFARWQGENIELLIGDFFALTAEDTADVVGVYDRAAIVALPSEMRQQYADHLTHLLRPGTPILMITFTYPQHEMNGPPFSVSDEEVFELFQASFEVEHLRTRDILANVPPRFTVSALTLSVFRLLRL